MAFLRHVWQSRPSGFETALSAILWAIAMPVCALAGYFFMHRMLPPNAQSIAFIYSLGAAVAAPVTFWCVRILALHNTTSVLAAVFIALSLSTIGSTALVFAFDFWTYFSQTHAETFSKLWLVQFVFTFGSAVYQFLVSGLRLYLPFGLFALVFASMWICRRIVR